MSFHQTVKTGISIKVVASAAIFLSAFSAVDLQAQAQKANFSGEWKLNESKSTLGQFAQMAPRTLKADSQTNYLSVQRSATAPDGTDATYTEKVTFDGKVVESTVFGTAKKKSTAKWSDDGQTLTVNSNVVFDNNGQTFEIQLTEVWKLLENGKALSVETTSNSQMGKNEMKMVFDKV